MTIETLYAESLYSGSVAGSANVYGAPDGTYTTLTGNSSWTAAWAMQNPANAVAAGTHTITVRARKEAGQTGTPTVSVNLKQGATTVATIASGVSVTGTSQDVSGTFAGSVLTDPTDVNVEVVVTAAGGSPSTRTTVQIDAITWSGDFSAVSSVSSSVSSSWNTLASAAQAISSSWHVIGRVTAQAQASWNVRTIVQKEQATSWNTLVPVGASAEIATSWHVRARVSDTQDASWGVAARVADTQDATWGVRVVVDPVVTYWTGFSEVSCTVAIWNGSSEEPITVRVTE